jgi:hypothetical protein
MFMPVPWIAVGGLVLSNLDKIMAVVKPAFTRKPIEVPPNQPDLARQSELLNRQIAELQAAASAQAEQIRNLAAQVKEVVAALEQYSAAAAAHRTLTRRLSYAALGISILALGGVVAGALY